MDEEELPARYQVNTWKLSALAPKPIVQAALLAHDLIEDWDPDLVIAGREVAEDRPEDWVLEGWYPKKPGKAEKRALAGLFEGKAPLITVEELPPEDWVTLSQQNAQPIRAGRFHVHTPEFPADPDLIDFVIPASQAFGTGQHRTTAGCLEMLGDMKASGVIARNIADIGTGTGLLGFAALRLWPRAFCTLTDIDPVCVPVVEENAATNGIPLGPRAGEAVMIVADGMDDPLLRLRGPYDLLIANILAGPLVSLAPDFARAVSPGGSLLLAGLLAGEQEAAVRRAMQRAGFRMAKRLQRGDWAILWLRRRRVR
ncbi:50S ribosomal protein L11 methyltransferase [Porphyrobacter sp. HT-58-2]|uniref:50S ribosomal protein L11 methyltransferase n=1 Tax=Porphyrobacter sp. HT-58-2 TaxID=2023229 RepID=UPI000CDBB116|nr:50S ribosomal protein L11 methyltransferase [Porphyrobacter sp. HT-58-2]AUX70085.1 50S ribosomal protein L11 methyltransferase [Porphyrobacter sp. HT-58-2]